MKKVRYGIIGFGSFAERAIMPAIRSADNAELVAIQKRSIDMARWKADEHRIPLHFDSVESLVSSEQVDAVFIVSANSQHHAETIAAAKKGKHVLVEKPMATNGVEAKEMIDICSRSGVKFMVGHMLRFSPLIRRMKEIIDSGTLGEISFIRAHFFYDVSQSQRRWVLDKQAAGGGPLFDVGIHCLDTVRFLLHDDSVINVQSLNRPGAGADPLELTNVMSLQFSRGTLASIYSSYESSYRQAFIECFGTHGSMSADHFTPSNTDTVLEIRHGKNGAVGSTDTEQIRVPDLYRLEIEHFSNCILHNLKPDVDGIQSLHNQQILDRAQYTP